LTLRIDLSGTTTAALVLAGDFVRVRTGFARRRRQNGRTKPFGEMQVISMQPTGGDPPARPAPHRVSGAVAAEQNRLNRLFLLLSALFFSLFPIVLAPAGFSPPCQGVAL
jgi:hypothetical protein